MRTKTSRSRAREAALALFATWTLFFMLVAVGSESPFLAPGIVHDPVFRHVLMHLSPVALALFLLAANMWRAPKSPGR
ncbi:hypothetical protein [Arthrobacter sp. M4]|uniref:hypothetical protein n=1 Tax=Arthrobacter sp. M4 TaxID=218160 RepID=UPI001CDB5A40|nr:hypothetical protein [Arthrobacter sp. M4]MCA4134920.1 hypothetical protein [Arthrobacter sp. M4]